VDLSKLTVRELLALWAASLRELRDRRVVRTFNNPIADIAEELVALHYGGERGTFVQKSWDVKVGEELIQVKALRRNELFSHNAHVNGRIIRLTARLLSHPAVEEVPLSDAALDA